MRETRERSVSHNAMRAGTLRALQMRAKEMVLLGLIARRRVAICAANSSTLKTGSAMAMVTGDARGDPRDTSDVAQRAATGLESPTFKLR